MVTQSLNQRSAPVVPVRNAAEARANATYDALMWALARPGTIRQLPENDPFAVAEALVDRECRVFASDAGFAERIDATGACLASAAQADHAFLALDTPAGLAALSDVPTGSHLYPDEGATVFASATIGHGRGLRLSGPGIDGKVEIRIGGIPDEVWAIRSDRCLYPTGFELFLIDGDQVLGLPRSTMIEVL
ncbi:phosphonate C-P lyase system protein PhnH [Allorhizobium pseudoryzae]|uniref:phosphonate C-P lyase system protein PhnH n=1 Tax=Allorhizobium pseudoryzae TaxID=379684 RepID=UPI003D07BB00